MKHGASSAACIAQLIERAARREGKTGEGKVSTEAIASILELPGEPIFSETGVGGVATRISASSIQSDLRLLNTPDMLIRVEFPTPARTCMRVKPRTRRCGKLFHRSSTLNEATFSVQTSGATAVIFALMRCPRCGKAELAKQRRARWRDMPNLRRSCYLPLRIAALQLWHLKLVPGATHLPASGSRKRKGWSWSVGIRRFCNGGRSTASTTGSAQTVGPTQRLLTAAVSTGQCNTL
jgi:hypothetical protein